MPRFKLNVSTAQRRAPSGISLMHSGHFWVGSSAVPGFRRASSAFTGLTTRKKITAAMIRNEITALMNAP
jgi:hypothetical protein